LSTISPIKPIMYGFPVNINIKKGTPYMIKFQGILDGQLVEICSVVPVGSDSYIVYKPLGLDLSATEVRIKKKVASTYGASFLSLITSASESPTLVGGLSTSTELGAVASGNLNYFATTITGKQIIQPYATRPNFWRYASPSGGLVTSAGVTVKTAPPTGSRNCITSIQIINSHPSISTEVEIRDGAGGSVMWRGWAQAGGGGVSANFPNPIVGTNTTLIEVAEVTATASTGVLVNIQGYISAD
jgi:hypothetical protein